MSRSGSRSGSRSDSNDPRRGWEHSQWEDRSQDQRGFSADARRSSGDRQGRGSSHARSERARSDRARSTQRYDDRWRDERPQQGGGIWGDGDAADWDSDRDSPGGASWTDDAMPAWGQANGRAGGHSASARARGKANPREKRPLSQRIRYWLTAEAWQPSILRTWPSALRLLVVAALLGSCGGLGLFATRDQVGAQSGLTTGLSPLLHVTVGPGTPPPQLYTTWTPYPTQPVTPTPSTANPTPTTSPVQLLASLAPKQEQCSLTLPPLAPVTLALDNSHSSVAVNWMLTIGPDPNGHGQWATPSASSGRILARHVQQPPVTLTPDQTICGTVISTPKQLNVWVNVTPGSKTIPLTFTVEPPVGPSPTPSPSPSPIASQVPAQP